MKDISYFLTFNLIITAVQNETLVCIQMEKLKRFSRKLKPGWWKCVNVMLGKMIVFISFVLEDNVFQCSSPGMCLQGESYWIKSQTVSFVL